MNAFVGLISGLVIAFLLGYIYFKKQKIDLTTTSSVTIMDRVEKVFKVVLAEGFYSDIYDYKNAQNIFFNLVKSNKKALIIANARVLIGYDFAKVKFVVNEQTKQIILQHFPLPEILAIDPEYRFYDAENGIFNRFANEDYTAMIADAKARISEKALQSELPKIAAKQMQALLSNIDDNTSWQLLLQPPQGTAILLEHVELPHKA